MPLLAGRLELCVSRCCVWMDCQLVCPMRSMAVRLIARWFIFQNLLSNNERKKSMRSFIQCDLNFDATDVQVLVELKLKCKSGDLRFEFRIVRQNLNKTPAIWVRFLCLPLQPTLGREKGIFLSSLETGEKKKGRKIEEFCSRLSRESTCWQLLSTLKWERNKGRRYLSFCLNNSTSLKPHSSSFLSKSKQQFPAKQKIK